MRHRSIAFFSAAICAQCAFGQTSANINSGPGGFSGSADFGPPAVFGVRAATGAPYSGEEGQEQVQTLADGTHITRKTASTKVYRDSLGRTRTERPLLGGVVFAGQIQDSPTVVEITDPVTQVRYILDTINKVAHRQQLPSAPDVPRPAANGAVRNGVEPGGVVVGGRTGAPSQRLRPQIDNEKLGTRTIEGVLAEGTRTTTYPIDAKGNDRPFSVVNETWTSVALKVTILDRRNDPRSGEDTHKLTNISLAEPDASLFLPPSDYSVVDESGGFTMKWDSQK